MRLGVIMKLENKEKRWIKKGGTDGPRATMHADVIHF